MPHPVLLMAVMAMAPAVAQNRPVAALDLPRYSGVWHEIAHLPMFFQRKCKDRITATYAPRPDGTVEVRNACRTQDDRMEESIGVARPVAGEPGALKVRFAPGWLSWVPAVWADYWVVALDPDYQWALVGGPSRKYLWVLSRTPSMSKQVFDRIRAQATQYGYPTERLIMAAPLTQL